ncbi:efflux RND transporter periplasmic adaptor subunit [Mesoterricola silvestris]|uniref:MexH family multidrug efflux RND transporter periplasmic adaptor subunit n=1 Tax=Mesoterricola silvestris TaxID=2927979 RepID=A0AA48GHL5_9BACT|nr:efflux RND transporter periplasmic adaptor subunit [Mesoterricola silvestris]BDU71382.1 MexH family multidrug efflux RND transporter periplasmic adaptor subunit [Mesoterricola silvestris]
MSSPRILVYAALPAVLIAGTIGVHQYRKHAEIVRQRAQKQEGLVPVTLAGVENHSFRGAIAFTGTLLAVNRAELKAEVSGRVTRVIVQEGDRVGAGAVLSAQDEDDLLLSVQAAEAQLAQAQAQAQQARRDNERAQSLLEKRSVTRQSAQQAETNYNAAMAMVRAADSNLGLAKSRLRKSRITSPFAGEVAQRLIQPGEMLAPGQTAFTVVDNRKLEIQADLPAEAVAAVKQGMKASFRIAGFDQPFEATLTQVSGSVMQDGRTLRVRMEVPNADGRLKSGLFAEGVILGDGEVRRPALPSAILTAVGRDADVFVAENGVARRRRILVGPDQGGWRSVDGLPVGAQVVAQGRDLVADGTRLQLETEKGK